MNSMKLKLKKNDIFLFYFWVLYFTPLAILRLNGRMELLVLVLRFPIALQAVSYFVKDKKNKLGQYGYFLAAFLLWNTFCIFINTPRQLISHFIDLYQLVEMVIVLVYMVTKRKTDAFKPLFWVSVIYVYMNFLSMLALPNGIFLSSIGSSIERAQWMFGSKNNMPVYITLFSIIILAERKNTRLYKIFSILTILIGAYSTVSAGSNARSFGDGSSTGIITSVICLVAAVYLLIPKGRRKKDFFPLTIKRVVVITLALNIILLGGISVPVINTIVTDFLGKKVTFTNRIYIWANAIAYIMQSPIIGHGLVSIVLWGRAAYSTYNVFLGVMKSYGIPSAILLILAILSIPDSKREDFQIMLIGLLTVLINGLMSQIDVKFVFFFGTCLFLLSKQEMQEKPLA